MCDDHDQLLTQRFWLIGVVGTLLATFGVIANALLAALFLTRITYRHSPFFFLGFVAFYDTLLDFTYIILLPVPTAAEYFNGLPVYNFWIYYVRPAYLFGQISRISSVFCLIVASFERYYMTRHWTFTGFGSRTRWIILALVILVAISLKLVTFSDFVIVNVPSCQRFRRYRVDSRSENALLSGFLNVVSILLPFVTLIFLNGGIVLMLKRQHIQQLRSLMTELTMGKDVMKLQRHNLRSATHTLIVIITAYLISNLLNMTLTLLEFISPALLHNTYQQLYRLASDTASVLTVLGNAIRCPAHVLSNSDIRKQFEIMLCSTNQTQNHSENVVQRRRSSQLIDAPWISLFIVPTESCNLHPQYTKLSERVRRLSAYVCSSHDQPSSSTMFPKDRRNTYCVGSSELLTADYLNKQFMGEKLLKIDNNIIPLNQNNDVYMANTSVEKDENLKQKNLRDNESIIDKSHDKGSTHNLSLSKLLSSFSEKFKINKPQNDTSIDNSPRQLLDNLSEENFMSYKSMKQQPDISIVCEDSRRHSNDDLNEFNDVIYV